MPSSASEAIPYIIEFTRKNQPNLKSVLDVGIGFGKWGFLLREYFDVKGSHDAIDPRRWKLKITGVEIFEKYLCNIQPLFYDKIIIGDIIEILPRLGKYDLAVLSDIIEHLPKDKGLQLLDNLFKHVDDIVISTNRGFTPKPVRGKNIHETHLSAWALNDFQRYQIIDQAIIKRIRKDEELLVVYLRNQKTCPN